MVEAGAAVVLKRGPGRGTVREGEAVFSVDLLSGVGRRRNRL